MLVLDAFNILHTVGVLPPDLAGMDIPGLTRLILCSRHAGERIVFVCDGLPADDLPQPGPLMLPEHASASVDVRYSGRSTTADDLIRRIVDASTAPRRLTVVSSDHAIQRNARKRRCTVLTSEEFLQQLADDSNLPRGPAAPSRRPASAMSEEQVRTWINVFGVDENAPLTSEATPATPEAKRDSPHEPVRAPSPGVPESSGIDPGMPQPMLPEALVNEAEEIWQRERANASQEPAGKPYTKPGTEEPER